MFTTLFSNFRCIGNRCAYSVETVGGNTHSDSGTADKNTAISFSLYDGESYFRTVYRIIIRRVKSGRSAIHNFEIFTFKETYQFLFQFIPAVIGSDCHGGLLGNKIRNFLHWYGSPGYFISLFRIFSASLFNAGIIADKVKRYKSSPPPNGSLTLAPTWSSNSSNRRTFSATAGKRLIISAR